MSDRKQVSVTCVVLIESHLPYGHRSVLFVSFFYPRVQRMHPSTSINSQYSRDVSTIQKSLFSQRFIKQR